MPVTNEFRTSFAWADDHEQTFSINLFAAWAQSNSASLPNNKKAQTSTMKKDNKAMKIKQEYNILK